MRIFLCGHLIFRRMFFSQCQKRPSHIDCADSIQQKAGNGGSTCCCERDNCQFIFAPPKVIAPPILPWMKEGNSTLRLWIDSGSGVLFAVITVMAGEGKVIQIITSRFSDGNDMINSKGIQGEGFR